ncbi:MAG: hypothetical protein H6R14_148 [Proteobacteria bacterium]|nr:hypothetical protein [Pseudomonadota bacterium]
MKRRLALSLLLLSLLGPVGGVWAQGYWRDLPPDERRQMRQQMREHWQQERELRREDGVAPRWRDLPVEDRRRLRDDMREQRAWQEQRGQRPGFERHEQRGWDNPREGVRDGPRQGRGERGWRRD